jgi:endogenous inhibitor of DNA gyrase (YacG/DUF329 family)
MRQVTCPVCLRRFTTASEKRVFCSAQCRKLFHSRKSWRKRISDPKVKEQELQRLLAWKAAHRKQNEENAGWLEITII